MARTEASSLRIAHVSDIHVGAHDDLMLDGLAQDLADAAVAATIVTGDLTMRARTHEFARAKDVIDRFPDPTLSELTRSLGPGLQPGQRRQDPAPEHRLEHHRPWPGLDTRVRSA